MQLKILGLLLAPPIVLRAVAQDRIIGVASVIDDDSKKSMASAFASSE
jgi:hypothetical protein